MEPRIQYCTAPDGVNLAFYAAGHGPPIVFLPAYAAFGHLQTWSVIPAQRRTFEYLTPRMNMIRYDRRGHGLSDRDPADESLEANVSDLLAIIDRLEIDRVALHAQTYGGPVAITFAARYPERLSHLILNSTTASMPEASNDSPRVRAMWALLEHDWDLYLEVGSRIVAGWSEHDLATRLAAQARAAVTPEAMRRLQNLVRTWDASHLLSSVTAPTLVLESAPSMFTPRWTRALAAGIPGAEYREVGQGRGAAHAICEFVTGEAAPRPTEPAPLPEGMAIILFADIVDSTALTEQLGDSVFRARASRLDDAMRAGIRECGGTPIEGKVMGDGVMAVFQSARQAIEGGFRCEAAADGTGLALHLGLHAGDVLREANNVYGGAVNIASRISSLAAPGEVLVSDIVRGLARTSAGVTFEDRGEHALRGVADPQRVFAVRPAGDSRPRE
jgi:class 3 adenylate cyclase/pimeloyl-ACP methyl ester carboxylesterase